MSHFYKNVIFSLLSAILLLLFTGISHAQTPAENGVCYATTGRADGGRLLSIDLATGVGTLIGATGITGDIDNAVPGLTINVLGLLYGTDQGFRTNLYVIDAANGNPSLIGNIGLYGVDAMAFDAMDVLYVVDSENILSIVNDLNGEVTRIGPIDVRISGMAFDPTTGILWGSGGAGDDGIYTIDTATGVATKVGDTGLGGSTPDIHFDENGNLFGVKGGGGQTVTNNDFISIDKSTGAGTMIGQIGFISVSGLAFRSPALQGSQIGVTPPVIDFGVIEAGKSSTRGVGIKSFGTQDLTVNNISDPGAPFTLSGLPNFPAMLPPANVTQFDVTFSPSTPGSESATITVSSDDADNSNVTINLTAEAIQLNTANPGVCYASTGFADGGRILTIDPATGAGTLIGPSGLFAAPALAINSAAEIFTTSGSTEGDLYRIDATTGKAVFVGRTGAIAMDAMAFDANDQLFGIGISIAMIVNLYTIDTQTGTATVVAQVDDLYSGMAFDPTDGTLWVSTGGGSDANTPDGIFTMNPATGAANLVGTTGLGSSTPDIHFDDNGNLFGVKGGGGQNNSTLISIDKSNGTGTSIGQIGFTSVSGLAFAPPDPNSVEQSDTIPNIFSLEQNYPNPFNPSTTIRYQLPEATRVSLVIFNLLGQEVRTLIKAEKAAGDYSVAWDGKDKFGKEVASGVYVYRLKAGEFTDVKKLALTR